ncbi:MAG TPA: type II toxin-antitoxin system PemK/MazF family toxin [Anaerolineae bacterium]|nr:type II toxin-antitoxin system PemK/MazF family toxin [Anaerolineae bacterium]
MARGDVLRVEFPYPPGGAGREQAGRRPAIAVQTDVTSASLPTLMVVPLTGRLSALRFPHTIQVEPSEVNGLTQPSVLLVFQLRAIDHRRIPGKIGRLEQHYLNQLDEEMRRMLSL